MMSDVYYWDFRAKRWTFFAYAGEGRGAEVAYAAAVGSVPLVRGVPIWDRCFERGVQAYAIYRRYVNNRPGGWAMYGLDGFIKYFN